MNEIEKEQKKIYDDQTKAFMKDRKANAAEKKAPLKEEVAHKVGDTVYATHPVKRYTTMTGKVTRVGRTLTTLTHKDGTTGTYPHHDVNKDYEVLHPNPYTKERDKRANESVDEERNVTIGTTAWVKHPTDPKKRLSGKVTSVGKTHISLQHKDGTKEMYLHKDVAVASAKNESMDEAYTPGKTVYTSHMDKVLKGKVVEPDEEDKKFTIVNINGKRHSVHNDHIHSRAEHAGFMLEDVNESEFKGTPTVKTDKYSWGTMKTIHHGNSFSIPLHPDHQESISKLKDGDTHVFKDETRAKWTATRKGPTVHFAGSVGHTAVPYASLTEETKPMTFSQFTESKLTYDQFVKGRSPIPSKSDEELAAHAKKKPVGPGSGKWKQMIKAEIESRKTVKEGVFDWKANKSEVDWSDKKDKKTEKSAEGGTIHKAREGSRNAETGGKAAKKSVGRPAGEYGGYKIDKAKRDTPEYKVALSKKVMAAKAKNFATRKKDPNSDFAVGKDIQQHLQAAIKKRQEELWHADPANKK